MNKIFLLASKILIISVIIFGSADNLLSQRISGKIVEKKTGKEVPFATVSIEGTTIGDLSDFEGVFGIPIPENHRNGKLKISCVGYEKTFLNIKPNINKKNIIVKLKSKSIKIEEVTVVEKSLKPYNLVKKAVANISKNYINNSFNYEMYYMNKDKIENKRTKQRELIVLQYDKTGYKRTNEYKTFKNISYKFLQSKRNFKLKKPKDERVNLDEIMELDIVRNTGNILDIKRLKDFDISIEKETVYKGDSIWILTYSCNKPNLLNTGDFYANSYKGKLYIKKGNYTILYNETDVETKNKSKFGRFLYISPDTKEDKIKSAKYNFSVSYKLSDEKYILNEIKYDVKRTFAEKIRNPVYESNAKLIVKKIINTNPKKISGRKYYDTLAYNQSYWKK